MKLRNLNLEFISYLISYFNYEACLNNIKEGAKKYKLVHDKQVVLEHFLSKKDENNNNATFYINCIKSAVLCTYYKITLISILYEIGFNKCDH